MGSAADNIGAKLEAVIEHAAKALILEIAKELKRSGVGTPVDTGHARANWIPSIGHPHTTEVPGESNAAYQAGAATVLAYKIAQGTLYITNNVPYIRRLNDGWSDQAPALFVESAIDRAVATVKAKTGVDFGQLTSTAGG